MSTPRVPSETESLTCVDASRLCWRCDPSQLDFETTERLENLTEILGQARALEAVEVGIGMRRNSYHLYVQGPPGGDMAGCSRTVTSIVTRLPMRKP